MIGPDVVVFVYGTLMPGCERWPLLSPYAASWRPSTARGRLWDTGNGYPAATFDDDSAEIPGVVVAVATDRAGEAIALLDEVEGEGVLYRRVEISTSAGVALTYEWLGPTDGLAPVTGQWSPAVDGPAADR